MSGPTTLLPGDWPRPKGYAAGVEACGRTIYVSGMIGWDAGQKFRSSDFADQYRQVLENTIAVLKAGGASPRHIVRMTWYILDRDEYLASAKRLRAIWKELIGNHYPAMAVVIVSGLIEPEARLEIETTAVVPETPREA